MKVSMSIVSGDGRLGNQIIRNLAVSIICEKFDIACIYTYTDQIASLGIVLYSGANTYSSTCTLTDDTYLTILHRPTLTMNLRTDGYFQTKQIMDLLYAYLRKETVQSSIQKSNPFSYRYLVNNDVCVHVRLGDVQHRNPGIQYYLRVLSTLRFDTLYICTDTKDHAIVRRLRVLYPHAHVVDYKEVETIQFASTCKYLVLSHGSFSAIIGYLGFFSHVYYPAYTKMWHGDMFSIDGWKRVQIPRKPTQSPVPWL